MMQAMGVPPTGQVAISVAQRGVLQNPGGATGNLGGAAAGVAGTASAPALGRRSRLFNTELVAARQVQGGTPTNNNPVATQLLLAPTFTPIQANAVLDQTNMRIAIPVRQVDGEFILTMQKMEGGAAQAAQPATPVESARPAAAQSSTPSSAAELPKSNNTTEPASPKSERRQSPSPSLDKYGLPTAPQGAVIMSMKMVDDMVSAVQWGGQAPITQMMSEYVKAQTGEGLGAIKGAR